MKMIYYRYIISKGKNHLIQNIFNNKYNKNYIKEILYIYINLIQLQNFLKK